MEAQVQKQIIEFFTAFEEFYNTTKTCVRECQNNAVVINKLIARCKNIKEAVVVGTPLEGFVEIQNKLATSLHNLISEEVHEIRSKLSSLEDLFEKLCTKRKVLVENCRQVDFGLKSLLIKGTPLQPSLKQLLQFADDAITFGAEICAQIQTSLESLTVRGLNSVSLAENFKISLLWQLRVFEILSYTSFCSQNQI